MFFYSVKHQKLAFDFTLIVLGIFHSVLFAKKWLIKDLNKGLRANRIYKVDNMAPRK